MNLRPGSVKSVIRATLAAALLATLSGCGLFGSGSDKSEAQVTNWQRCKFDLSQAARVAGRDDADVVENVTVTPDCDVKIEFRQVTGDGVVEIESQGGLDVLERGSAVPEPVEEPQP